MNALQTFIGSKPCGFLTAADMPELIRLDRLCQVLIRCGGCRFTCAAQDADHIMQALIAAGDHVRDVSFTVGSLERAALWRPDCPVTPVAMLPASFTAPRPQDRLGYTCPHCQASFPDDECHHFPNDYTQSTDIACPKCEELFPEPIKTTVNCPDRKPVKDHRYYEPFNEGDCGGVFDGFSVSSDADPGL